MKRYLPLVAILLAIGGFVLWRHGPDREQTVSTPTDESTTTTHSSGRPTATRPSFPLGHRPGPPPVSHAPGAAPGSPEDFEAMISQDLAKRQEAARETKIDGYAATLKDSLHLTDEQVAAIRAILNQDGSVEAGVRPASLPESADVAAVEKGTATAVDADTRIAALLDPTQLQDYAALRNEQRERRTDTSLARDMSQLQRTVKLSPDQESRIREAFGNLAWNEEEKAPGFRLDVAKLREKKQARLEILRTVLTEDQLKSYEAK